MKISNEPTPYLLLKAGTDSAWDCCDFAIVYLSKEWRQTQSGRLEASSPFKDDISFQSLTFMTYRLVLPAGRGRDTGQRGLAGRQ